MTNAVPLIQLAAQHAGYQLSGAQIAGMLAAGGAAVRWLHVEAPIWIGAYARAGGWRGILRFLDTGSTAEPSADLVRPTLPHPGPLPLGEGELQGSTTAQGPGPAVHAGPAMTRGPLGV